MSIVHVFGDPGVGGQSTQVVCKTAPGFGIGTTQSDSLDVFDVVWFFDSGCGGDSVCSIDTEQWEYGNLRDPPHLTG